MARRNLLEIAAEILKIAEEGEMKTHIVYMANLNHRYLKDLLDRLEEKGLIINGEHENEVKTTEKGLKFIQYYSNLQYFFDDE